MVGEVIYPLNRLVELDHRLFEFQVAKYAGREAVLDFRIPGLDVRFNDAVHCAALHPYHLYTARRALGFEVARRPEPPAWATGLAFEIPLERIVQHPVIWYSWRTLWINAPRTKTCRLSRPQTSSSCSIPSLRPLDRPTDAHLDYLRRMKARGERGLMLVHIPHVLVSGPIDVGGLRVVGWDEPPSDD